MGNFTEIISIQYKSNRPEMDPCGAPHSLFTLAVFNELGLF